MKLTTKEQKDYFLKLGDLIIEASDLSIKLLDNLDDEGIIERLQALEELADNYKETLDAHYSSQRNIPFLAMERTKLLRRIDDIMDKFALLGRLVRTFRTGIEDGVRDKFKDKVKILNEMGKEFTGALTLVFTDFKEARDHSTRVQKLNDQLMSAMFQLEAILFKQYGKDDWKQFIASEKISKTYTSIGDQMNLGAEIIELMIIKYSNE